ncbi:MAG: membrane dipeptidase [Firmicutes bacterium]|nr:membrane dipeptidase [Bacillota bacterium]
MYIFDAHIDTLSRLLIKNEDLAGSGGHVDLERLRKGKIGAQFFAAFIHPHSYHGQALHSALEMIDVFWQTLDKYPEVLGFAGSGQDFVELEAQGKIACLLAVEGGEALEGKLAQLRNLYRLGVRLITLTWNHRNALASGQLEGDAGGGLSLFGRQVVEEMNRLKMLIDVSHLNDPGFWDVLELSKAPVIASHSNVRALCSHPRNLTDQQIKSLAERGGVIGVNFCPAFLVSFGDADLENVVEHIAHLVQVGGEDCVGLGSDFDGISSTPNGLSDCSQTQLLAGRLKQKGYGPSVIEKIMGRNLLRICRDVLD